MKPPWGGLLSTGEELSPELSGLARIIVVPIEPGNIDNLGWPEGHANYKAEHPKLDAAQAASASGLLAKAMAGYIDWLAPQMQGVQERTHAAMAQARRELPAQHPQTRTRIAELMVGVVAWLKYAQEKGAVKEAEAEAWKARAWSRQGARVASSPRSTRSSASSSCSAAPSRPGALT